VEKARKNLNRRKSQVVAYYGHTVRRNNKCAIQSGPFFFKRKPLPDYKAQNNILNNAVF